MDESRIADLNRRVKYLYVFCSILAVLILYLFILRVGNTHMSQTELTLQDSTGKRRMFASAKLPNPSINGKEYKRDINVGGITLYDSKGNESGGIGMVEQNGIRMNLLAFDYSLHDA